MLTNKIFNASTLLLPCIVIIASLHHISHNIVIIHLTLGNSQGRYVMRLRLSVFAHFYSF